MKYYTIKNISQILKVSTGKIYYEILSSNVPSTKVNKKIVIPETGLNFLRKKFLSKQMLMTINQYCKQHHIGRDAFNYRRKTGRIKTIQIDGRIFVKGRKNR